MDASAIKLIQDTAIEAAKANMLGTFSPAIMSGGKIIELENLQEGRSRFRGEYSTIAFQSFVEYVKSHIAATDRNVGFVDQSEMSCVVFFNLGDVESPGHGDWRARLNMKPTTEFYALLKANGNRFEQRALCEWMEDWAHCLSAEDEDGNEIPFKNAISAIRKITIKETSESTHAEKNLGARRSSMEDIEAMASGMFPHRLIFSAEPYATLSRRSFSMRLSIITSTEKPAFTPRIVSLERAMDDIANEFMGKLQDQIGYIAHLYVGSFDT